MRIAMMLFILGIIAVIGVFGIAAILALQRQYDLMLKVLEGALGGALAILVLIGFAMLMEF